MLAGKDWPRIVSVALMTIGVLVVVCCVFDLTPFAGTMADDAAAVVTDGRVVAAGLLALVASLVVVALRRRRATSR
jgi:hypothetical protein